MNTYARIYRSELQELTTAPRAYRLALRLALTVAAFVDRYPRATSVILAGFSLWAAVHIFLNYHFTTAI